MNQPINKVYSLLKRSKNCGLVGSSGYTHVSMGNIGGHYYLSATNDHEFYQNYNQLSRVVLEYVLQKNRVIIHHFLEILI